MKYFDIITEIHRPSLKVQPCEKSSRETEDQILEDVTLTKYLKKIKVKRKWLYKFWVILIYNKKIYMVFSSVSWMNGLLIFFIGYWLNEWFNEFFSSIEWSIGLLNDLMNGLMNVFFSYWMIEWLNGLRNDLKNDLMKSSFSYLVK